MTPTALIAALEKAEAGSRELDAEVWLKSMAPEDIKIFDGVIHVPAGISMLGEGQLFLPLEDMKHEAPHYTTSLDAALTIVPEGFWWDVSFGVRIESGEGPYWASVYAVEGDVGWMTKGEPHEYPGRLAALALCTAALRARGEG